MSDIFENKGFDRIDENGDAVADADDDDDEFDEFRLSPDAFEIAAGEWQREEGNEELSHELRQLPFAGRRMRRG